MKEKFGTLADGREASLYTITSGPIRAVISDFGAALVKLFVPDDHGNIADVVLGFDSPEAYAASTTFMGAVVGRNANRIKNARFTMNGREYTMDVNDGKNNLHSGRNFFKDRLWQVKRIAEDSIVLTLESPSGDQGFAGRARIAVTYQLVAGRELRITYDGRCDQDTVFNYTNHSYFNLAGHNHPEKAMNQVLTMPARYFTPDDDGSIPTGEIRSVEGTPMDFRIPKALGRDIDENYDALNLQGGYDHNYEVLGAPCAILTDPESGRTMSVTTDCCGLQLYTGNFLMGEIGKDGVVYGKRSGVCLETQFYPDSVNHPEWKQPFVKAGDWYHSETKFRFS